VAAAENVLLAATALELGSCYLEVGAQETHDLQNYGGQDALCDQQRSERKVRAV